MILFGTIVAMVKSWLAASMIYVVDPGHTTHPNGIAVVVWLRRGVGRIRCAVAQGLMILGTSYAVVV